MSKFFFNTAGESHGKGLIAIVEGMVADLAISENFINNDLKRRQKGYGRGTRMTIENDAVEIFSGVRHGFTIGTPICLLISNKDWINWQDKMSINLPEKQFDHITSPRPGHADLAGLIKYGLKDIRPIIERASARETAIRVAVGAIARRFLEEFKITIHSHTISIGNLLSNKNTVFDWNLIDNSPLRCADPEIEKTMISKIDHAIEEGDTLGGTFEVIAFGVPVGLGSHVQWQDKLDGQIARAFMSINAVKGVEIGCGFAMADMKGSEAHDIIQPNTSANSPIWQRVSNHAGGIEGGISNGQPIVVRAAVKPIATLRKALPSIDLSTGNTTEAHYERSDVCIVPAAGVIGEAMLAIVLADAMLNKFGGDNLRETLKNYNNFISQYS